MGKKVSPGINDLATLFPEVATQADGWDTKQFFPGSHKLMPWKCELGHKYIQQIKVKTKSNSGCPICSGKRVLVGFNDLKTLFPQIASQAEGWDPTTVSKKSDKRCKWKCELGHIWWAQIKTRTPPMNCGCPICANQKVLAGFNDLKTRYPDIASQAYQWDPSTVLPHSHKKAKWICKEGHIYDARISDKSKGDGCPFCANKRVLPGFNDLETHHPRIAAEAHNWDPSQVLPISGKRLQFKCKKGHIWRVRVADRTSGNRNCPYCTHQRIIVGETDLQTRYPSIAQEAYGWDPSLIFPGANAKKEWQCKKGHIYKSVVSSRTTGGVGCPICAGTTVLKGFNDLATIYPEIAKEAYEWNPSTVTVKSNKKLSWICKHGHKWNAIVGSRTPPNASGCPICDNQKLLIGFNDLATTHPLLALEAHGWNPKKVLTGTEKKLEWKCSEGHIWTASASQRIGTKNRPGTGCPDCAEYGFSPNKDAYFYLMQRPEEQQLGITNCLEQRIKQHKREGWILIDQVGPKSGKATINLETAIKRWLKDNVKIVKGTSENWKTEDLYVKSLVELKQMTGIQSDLF